MKASLVLAKFNQPRCAAQQTAAGVVRQRNPVRQPNRRQKTSNIMSVAMHVHLDASILNFSEVMSRSAIPPSPMASWTVWFTTLTASKCAASPCARNAIRHRTRTRNEPKPVSVRCLSYGTNFPEPDSGQLPELASGVGRCSTADESHAEPHEPITAGLQDSGTIRVSQGVIGYFSRLDKIGPFVTRLVAVQTMAPSRGLFGTVWFSCRWRYNFFNNTNVRSSASEVVFRNWITDV